MSNSDEEAALEGTEEESIDVHSWLKTSTAKVQSLEKGVGHLDERVGHLDTRVAGLEQNKETQKAAVAAATTSSPSLPPPETTEKFNVYDFM